MIATYSCHILQFVNRNSVLIATLIIVDIGQWTVDSRQWTVDSGEFL